MAQRAAAYGAVVNVFPGLGGGQYVGKSFVIAAHIGGQHHGCRTNQCDGLQVFAGIKAQVGDQSRVDRMGVKHYGIGVTVWRGLRHLRGTDGTGGTALVLHYHGLAELRLQLQGQNTRHLVD
jgi:hypothetical protein